MINSGGKYVPPHKRAQERDVRYVQQQQQRQPRYATSKESAEKKQARAPYKGKHEQPWARAKELLVVGEKEDDAEFMRQRMVFAGMTRLINMHGHVVLGEPRFDMRSFESALGDYAKLDVARFHAINAHWDTRIREKKRAFAQTQALQLVAFEQEMSAEQAKFTGQLDVDTNNIDLRDMRDSMRAIRGAYDANVTDKMSPASRSALYLKQIVLFFEALRAEFMRDQRRAQFEHDDKLNADDPRGDHILHLMRWMLLQSKPAKAKSLIKQLTQTKGDKAKAELGRWQLLTHNVDEEGAQAAADEFQVIKKQGDERTRKFYQKSVRLAIAQAVASNEFLRDAPNMVKDIPANIQLASGKAFDHRFVPVLVHLIDSMAAINVYQLLSPETLGWLNNSVRPQLRACCKASGTLKDSAEASVFVSIAMRSVDLRQVVHRVVPKEERKANRVKGGTGGFKGSYVGYSHLRMPIYTPPWLKSIMAKEHVREFRLRNPYVPNNFRNNPPFDVYKMKGLRKLERDFHERATRRTHAVYSISRWMRLLIDQSNQVLQRKENKKQQEASSGGHRFDAAYGNNSGIEFLHEALHKMLLDSFTACSQYLDNDNETFEQLIKDDGRCIAVALAHVSLPARTSDPIELLGDLFGGKPKQHPVLRAECADTMVEIVEMYKRKETDNKDDEHTEGRRSAVIAQTMESESWCATFVDVIGSIITKALIYKALFAENPDAFRGHDEFITSNMPERVVTLMLRAIDSMRYRHKTRPFYQAVEQRRKLAGAAATDFARFDFEFNARRISEGDDWARMPFQADLSLFGDWMKHVVGAHLLWTDDIFDTLEACVRSVANYTVNVMDKHIANVIAAVPKQARQCTTAVFGLSKCVWSDDFRLLDIHLEHMQAVLPKPDSSINDLALLLVGSIPMKRMFAVLNLETQHCNSKFIDRKKLVDLYGFELFQTQLQQFKLQLIKLPSLQDRDQSKGGEPEPLGLQQDERNVDYMGPPAIAAAGAARITVAGLEFGGEISR